MFRLQKDIKMRIIACFIILSMILTAISPWVVVYANEATESSIVPTNWNFHGGEEGANSGSVEGTIEEFDGIQINDQQGKIVEENGDTQMNPGTELAVPVSGSAITTTISLSADNVDAKTYTQAFEVGKFMITATSGKTVAVDGSVKPADDGKTFSQRIKLGGTGAVDSRSIRFSVPSEATVKVYAMSSKGEEDRVLDLMKSDGTKIGSITAYGASLIVGTINITEAGEYYLASPKDGVNVYGVDVTYEGSEVEPERPDWDTVVDPSITSVVQDGPKMLVTFELVTGTKGADKANVVMMDATGAEIDRVFVVSNELTNTRTAEFIPAASGNYTFKVIAERNEETTLKVSSTTDVKQFVLPLATPTNLSATSIGGGSVKISWNEVKEADGYMLSYKVKGASIFEKEVKVTENLAVIDGLTIGTSYVFAVKAMRGAETTKVAETEVKVTEEKQREWFFSAFGSGVNTTDNYFIGSANNGSVTVASENGKGKIVPASTDGLAYYYTTIDPETENFILSAKVTVDAWTFSNGQEGFGLMAADAVGEHGNASVFWNNSYMASVTKVEYLWDSSNNKVSDTGDKISMNLGIGAQEKIGATAENIALGTTVSNFKSTMNTLETSCAKLGTGKYNVIGNYKNATPPTGSVDESKLLTTLDLTIQRDNTGYRISYTDAAGNKTTKLYYDIERDALTKVDSDNIYVGFFASRYAKMTVTDIKLTVSNPETDPPAEEIETTYVTPSYRVLSTKDTGSKNYELVFMANADGVLSIKDLKDNAITANETVSANTYVKKNVNLSKGANTYTITFTPDKNYKPGENQELKSYDTETFTHTVNYKNYDRKSLYVSPTGSSTGDGSKSNPLDIYSAVKYVTPGQKIVLAGGTYTLNSSLQVERGISGTKDSMIYLIADPEATTRPVFDFNKKGTGIIFAGDYWYMKGFDVTNTADGQKGIQLSGDYCTLDSVHTYRNGNTGIQISRFLSSDTYVDWPSYNLVLNCTSYANADKGYEDADGFAAKLTIADGNVFDGCIAYNNADDGWDLFAKVESGPIGKVVIMNSVAYGNGYLPDGTNAGNGNGFKLGGSSISGYHELINSVSFNNKAKGIDSNSCPDIQVYNSTTFNNESYNVAFYTNDVPNTDFFANGIISFRTKYKTVEENLKGKGTQDQNKITGATNYYWSVASGTSANSENKTVAEDWFVNLDTTTKITRNVDGTINMNGLLELTDKAPSNAGARIAGTPSKDIVIEEEGTTTPRPTSAPTSTPVPFNPEKTLEVELSVGANGTADWAKVNQEIKETLAAFNRIENAGELKALSIEINMNGATKISNELLETLQGQNVEISIILNNGIKWTIDGKDISEIVHQGVDLAVNLNTKHVPEKAIDELLNTAIEQQIKQISLLHNGNFGFKAELTINLSDMLKGFEEAGKSESERSNKIAGIYYFDSKTGKLVLQSASKLDKDGNAEFSFTHASEYVILINEELIIDYATLSAITVNGVNTEKLAKRWRYVGGTTGNTEKLEIVLPAGLQEAVDKGLVPYKASYETSNRTVAIVSKDGLITAKKPGIVTVKTTLTIGDKTFVYMTRVTVKKAFIKFVKSTKEIAIGSKATFEVEVYGYDVKDIDWLTSKKGISIVYRNLGKSKAVVTGTSIGTEEVIARVLDKNGNFVNATTKISVTKPNKKNK